MSLSTWSSPTKYNYNGKCTSLTISFPGNTVIVKGEEAVEGVLLEHGGVSKKSVIRGHAVDFNQSGHTGHFPVLEVASQEGDSVKSLVVLTKSGNEKKGGFAPVVLEGHDKAINVGISLGDPGKIVGGVLDLGFNVLSVSSSITKDIAVGIPNAAKLVDLVSIEVFFLLVGLIEFLALVKCALLKIVQDLHDRVDGVTCLGLGFQHGVHFVVGGLSVHSCECDEEEEDSG